MPQNALKLQPCDGYIIPRRCWLLSKPCCAAGSRISTTDGSGSEIPGEALLDFAVVAAILILVILVTVDCNIRCQ